MPNNSNARSGRLYLATQGSVGTAAALTGSNCCRHSKVKLSPSMPRSPRNDKTGTLSRTPGVAGLRMASVSVEMDLAANGAPGVKPDCDPILQSLFGQAPVIVGATSVTYNLADACVPITMGHFRLPSTVQQQIAFGVAISEAQWGFNDGVISKWRASGSGVWVPDSMTYSTLDTTGKGGLLIGAFTEPGSPVTNGGVATAFTGSLTANSVAVANVKSGTFTFRRPVSPQRAFGGPYVTGWGLGLRDIQLKFDLFDDDSASMLDLVQHGINDTVFGATLVLGNVAGNIWTFTLTGLQVTPPSLDDSSGDRWVAQFDNLSATSASITTTTELTLAIT